MEKTTGQTLENYKIEPFTLVHDILINWWAILLGALAAAMLSYVFVGIRYVPQYTTSTTFVVSSRGTTASYSSITPPMMTQSTATMNPKNFKRPAKSPSAGERKA